MTTKLSSKKTALIATAAIAALAIGASGVFAQNAGQAFAQVQNQTAQTPQTDNNGKVMKAIVKDIRDHDGKWTGLSTVSHSLVPGVKILGVVETSNNTVSVTFAHMSNGAIDNSAVTQNFTLVAVAGHQDERPAAHLDGSTVVSSGWSGVKTVDLKLDGTGSLFTYHLIRVAAIEYTGSQ